MFFRFKRPTEIQNAVISCAIKERCDLLGAAETGSGKTFAFAIPLITRLLEEGISKKVDKPLLGGLILAPTRELVMQIKRQIDALLKFTKFKIITIVGGLSQQKQERLLSYCPEIIVATPGRFWAFLQTAPSGNHLEDFSGLKCFVIDEMDRMVEKEISFCIAFLVYYIYHSDEKMQTLVFSATLTFVHPPPKRLISQSKHMTTDEKIQQLAAFAALRKNYKTIDLTRSFGTAERLVEAKINCANLLEKDTAVLYLLKRYIGRTLLFINSIDAARRLHGILKKPLMLHAKMIQKQRLKNLEKFAENSVLLATDVAARGLDVQNVEHVIHYQIPKTAELYIHRSGRTARASHRGLTILLVDLLDVQFYRRICQNLNREKDLSIFPIDSQNLYSALKERVGVATDLESVEYRIKKVF
ncbi:unnamed protein product [Dracunculus medinensis]|uniref:ATP-dependent RNA helicase n=1 Tax=Dracunculus medinensis TaxID=318479 RepID=A0A0N4UAA6_DRAME|nr:unnamed protein product [Dracunculus medinensis]